MIAMPTAVITGAAQGIGRATARAFLDHGWHVLGLDVDGKSLSEMTKDWPNTFRGLTCDVASAPDVKAAVGALDEFGGELRACLNVAGVYPRTSLGDYDAATYRLIFDVSVLGTVNVTAACRSRLESSRGTVVNLASTGAFAPVTFHLFYSAAKAAVVSLTRSMALELAPCGVRVNALAPGYTRTDRVISNARMEGFEDQIPLRRAATPEEVADILWLMAGEDRLSYMTGETVLVSGGSPMR